MAIIEVPGTEREVARAPRRDLQGEFNLEVLEELNRLVERVKALEGRQDFLHGAGPDPYADWMHAVMLKLKELDQRVEALEQGLVVMRALGSSGGTGGVLPGEAGGRSPVPASPPRVRKGWPKGLTKAEWARRKAAREAGQGDGDG